MDTYIKLPVVTSEPVEKDLVIRLLSQLGYEGFEEQQHTVHAYILQTLFDSNVIEGKLKPLGHAYSFDEVTAKNWNEEWESSFRPVIVDNFCCIRASFHAPVEGINYDIIITPKMSFGTGHHATTYLMIKRMKEIPFSDLPVLDFGTGTGVLAILAEKMGAAKVLAIDNDRWSIENAAENIQENGCQKITLLEAGAIETSDRFDVILANINRNVLLNAMVPISQHLRPGGVLVMSGLLSGDKTLIGEKAAMAGLEISSEEQLDGWIVLTLIHN